MLISDVIFRRYFNIPALDFSSTSLKFNFEALLYLQHGPTLGNKLWQQPKHKRPTSKLWTVSWGFSEENSSYVFERAPRNDQTLLMPLYYLHTYAYPYKLPSYTSQSPVLHASSDDIVASCVLGLMSSFCGKLALHRSKRIGSKTLVYMTRHVLSYRLRRRMSP